MPASRERATWNSASHDKASPTSGMNASTQGESSKRWSRMPSTTMRSNSATANPVATPVIAASTITSCERRANSRKRRVVSPGVTTPLR